MSANDDEMDPERVETIAQAALFAVRENYLRGPNGNGRVLEALNALAACAAVIIAGTNSDDARAFFDKALDDNIGEANIQLGPKIGRA